MSIKPILSAASLYAATVAVNELSKNLHSSSNAVKDFAEEARKEEIRRQYGPDARKVDGYRPNRKQRRAQAARLRAYDKEKK